MIVSIPDNFSSISSKHSPNLWDRTKRSIIESGRLEEILAHFGFPIRVRKEFECPKCRKRKASLNREGVGRCNSCHFGWSNIIDLIAQLSGRDPNEVCKDVGDFLGVSARDEVPSPACSSPSQPTPSTPKQRIFDFRDIPPKLASMFCFDKGFSPKALEQLGARYATWQQNARVERNHVLAIDVYGPDMQVVNHSIRSIAGSLIVLDSDGKFQRQSKRVALSGPERVGILASSEHIELIRACKPLEGVRVVKVEGDSDLLAIVERLPSDEPWLCFTNSDGSMSLKTSWIIELIERLKPVEWVILHDRDRAGEDGALRWAKAISEKSNVKISIPILPLTYQEKKGPDLRDWFRDGASFDDFRRLVDASSDFRPMLSQSIIEGEAVEEEQAGEEASLPIDRRDKSDADPHDEAKAILQELSIDSACRLVFWNGGFLLWSNGQYDPIPNSEAKAIVVNSLNKRFKGVGTSLLNNVMEQLRACSLVPSRQHPPSWLSSNKWKPSDCIATKNAIVHLPSYVGSKTTFSIPSTPKFFVTASMDYDFRNESSSCPNWLRFLNQLWPNDQESIDTLQEWFGYCLTPDTSHQKILMLLGIKRSGKGTICRILRSLIGENNVAGPTLSSLQGNFGLWPLFGKTLAIVSDARLSGRSDQAVITERLLSISGEDAQTIDRKCMEPITTKLSTRLVIVSNELPRLQDSSGALVGRMIVLKLKESFFGKEDQTLSDRLMHERSGILHWAIDGWKRLRERGSFQQPKSAVDLVQQMDELASPISSFVEDRCVVDDALSVSVADLYEAWCEWCKQVGREPGTSALFGRDLGAYLPRLRRTNNRCGSFRERRYEGIGIG